MIVKNFLFHRINDEVDNLWPPMKPLLFEKIVRRLMKTYHIVNLETYLNEAAGFKDVNKPIATILFDDGYRDNIQYAVPILQKYKCPASFYIVTDCVDRDIPTWTYILDYCLQHTSRSTIELNYGYVPEDFKKLVLNPGLQPAARKLKPWMKTQSNAKRLQLMQAILEQICDVNIPGGQMMSWNDIKQLINSGFNVGSHTDTHPMLAQLDDKKEIEAELRISYNKIERQTGYKPITISYPIGSYDKRVMELSKQAGYMFGLAVEQKFYNTKIDDLFAIPRVELYQQAWYKVNARITGMHSIVKSLWK